MFERFTRSARQTVIGAQEEARRLRSPQIGSEHLLLALTLAHDSDPARATLAEFGLTHASVEAHLRRIAGSAELDADALSSVGIDLEEVRRRVEAEFGAGALDAPAPTKRRRWMPFGEDAKMALELALREAIALGHREIGSAHLLLGVLRSPGLGVRIMKAAGIEPSPFRTHVANRLRISA